jgi:hypothetical protein
MFAKFFLPSALVLIAALNVHAQTPGASQQVDSAQQRRQLEQVAGMMVVSNAAPELYPGETGDTGPQSVVQYQGRRQWLQASADAQYFYSDNVFLANSGKQSADVLVSTVSAALAPTPFAFGGGTLAPRLGFQEQWFSYGLLGNETVTVVDFVHGGGKQLRNISTFDFNSATAFADATWSLGNWSVSAGLDSRWLLDSGTYNQFYRELVPRWSAGYTLGLCPRTAVYLGYEGDFRFTETEYPPTGYSRRFNNRTDQALVLIGSWRLCDHAILQPYYRFQYSGYTNNRRNDFLHSLGLALYCPLTRQIALRAFVGYDNLHTDGFFVQNYEKLDAGGGLNLTVRF